jgi:hypothetical protein
MDKGNRKG